MTLRDADRFKDKIEVSLDTRQIFFLFFGGAVVACLVFVLGVMVGRRLEGREQLSRRAATSAAIDPLAALNQLGADEARRSASPELAFPSALAGKGAERDKPLGAADVAPERPVPGTGELRAGDPKPMVEVKTPAEPKAAVALAPPAALPVAPPPVKKPEPVKVEAKPEAKAEVKPEADKPKVEARPEVKPEAKLAAKDDKKPEPAKVEAKPSKDTPAKSAKGKYTLQLSSFQVRGEADAFAAKVSAAGYRPYVIQSEVEGKGTFFRVRLGEYGSHDEALAAKTDFETKQHIIAYVTRI